MLFRNIPKCTRGRHVTHGIAALLAKHIIGNRNECIFFNKKAGVFANKAEWFNMGINCNTKVLLLTVDLVAKSDKVFR
jgi:hypothetical protein